MTTSLRFSKEDLLNAFRNNMHRSDLMALKHETFNSFEEVCEKTKHILNKIFNEPNTRPYSTNERASFIYLYAKFDDIYQQEQLRLQSLSQVQLQDPDSAAKIEMQAKQRISDLLRFEITIQDLNLSEGTEQISNLTSLLEVYFDDIASLDILLLVLAHKISDQLTGSGLSDLKAPHFMLPFVKIFGKKDFDVLNLWHERKETQEIDSHIATLIEEIKAFLNNSTQLSEKDILGFIQDISANGKSIHQRRVAIRGISQKKESFKDENLYYQALGSLSVLQYLWSAIEDDERIATAFLKCGIISNVFIGMFELINCLIPLIVESLTPDLATATPMTVDFLRLYNEFPLAVEFESPKKMLQYILNRLNTENLEDHYIQLLDLQLLALRVLNENMSGLSKINTVNNIKMEFYDLFFQKEFDDKECVWSRLSAFFTLYVQRLTQIKSNYRINDSVYFNLVQIWAIFANNFYEQHNNYEEEAIFISKWSDTVWNLQCTSRQIFIDKDLQFSTSTLPLYIRRKVVANLSYFSYMNGVFQKEDLERLFEKSEEEAIAYLQQIKQKYETSDTSTSEEYSNLYLSLPYLFECIRGQFKPRDDPSDTQFLERRLKSSKFIKYLIAIYQEKTTWIRNIKNPVDLKIVLQLLKSIIMGLSRSNITFGESEEHEAILELIIQDVMSLDSACPLNNKEFEDMAYLLQKGILAKRETWELIILFFRFFWFKQEFNLKYPPSDFEYVLGTIPGSEVGTKILLELFQRFITSIEQKMKDPTVDYIENLRKLEEEAWARKKDDNEMNQEEAEKNAEIPLTFNLNKTENIRDGRISLEELKDFAFRCSYHLHSMACCLLKYAGSYYDSVKELYQTVLKRVTKLVFTPLVVLVDSKEYFTLIQGYINSLCNFSYENIRVTLEGIYEGVTEICETFSLEDNTNISNMNFKNIAHLLKRLQCYESSGVEPVSQDLSWGEAALMSLFIGIKLYAQVSYLKDPYYPFSSYEFLSKFEKASSLLLQVTANLYKGLYKHLSHENVNNKDGDWTTFFKKYKKVCEPIQQLMEAWILFFLQYCQKPEELTVFQEICLKCIVRLDVASIETNKKARAAYNLNILKEFTTFISISTRDYNREFIQRMLLKSEVLTKILAIEKFAVVEYLKHPNRKDQTVILETLSTLECLFQKEIFNAENWSPDATQDNGAEEVQIKTIILEITSIIKEMELQKLLGLKYSKNYNLLYSNISSLYSFISELYKVYAKCLEKHQKQSEELPEKPIQQEEALSKFKLNLEDSLNGSVYFVKKGCLLKLGEQFNTIPRQFWLNEYEKIYRTTLEFISEVLNKETNNLLKQELVTEIQGLSGSTKDLVIYNRSGCVTFNKIITLYTLFSCINKFLAEEIAQDIKLSQVFIEGLVVAVTSLLREILAQDLALLRKDVQEFGLWETMKNLISEIVDLVTHYIIAQTGIHFSVIDDSTDSQPGTLQSVLLASIELIDVSLSLQDFITQISPFCLDEEAETNLTTFMNLMHVIIRSNKTLRLTFLNKGILSRFLTLKKFISQKVAQRDALISLFGTLLEDSLMVENQLELVLKSTPFEELASLPKVKLIGNYKRLRKVVSNYQTNAIGKCYLSDYRTNKEGAEKVNMVRYLQEAISPVAKKSLQILLKALFSNLSLESDSYAIYTDEMKKIKETEKLKRQEKWSNFPHDEDKGELEIHKRVPHRDVPLQTITLSSILTTYPHLIPHVIFQEANTNDILSGFKEDDPIWIFFSSNKQNRYTILDVLIRVLLLKDAPSTLFLVGALLNDKEIFIEIEDEEDNKQEVSLRYLVLIKVFKILEEILDAEHNAGTVLRNFESMMLRWDIARLLSYIYQQFVADFTENQEEIHKCTMTVIQKLLDNLSLLAQFIQKTELQNHTLLILTDIINQITQTTDIKVMSPIFKEQIFTDYIFKVDNSSAGKEILQEEQKAYEPWDEKEQWEKQETMKLMAITKLKENLDLLPQMAVPLNAYTAVLVYNSFSSIYTVDSKEYLTVANFYTIFERKESNRDFEKRKEYFEFYSFARKRNNRLFEKVESSVDPRALFSVQLDRKPMVLRYIDTKAQELDNDTTDNWLISEKNEEVQQTDRQEEGVPENNVVEEVHNVVMDGNENEQIQTENLEENPIPETGVVAPDEGLIIRYFENEDVKSERNLKYQVNRAFKLGKRLKEVICLEKTLNTLRGKEVQHADIEGLIVEYTKDMRVFDRSVVYATLGKEIKQFLSEKMRTEVESIEEELNKIKEDYYSTYQAYLEKLREQKQIAAAQPEQDEAMEESASEASEYDELEDNYQFFINYDEEDENNSDSEIKDEQAGEHENENESEEKGVDLIQEELQRTNKEEVDDEFLLRLCTFFFFRYPKHDSPLVFVVKFSKDDISRQLKILDALLFILYTPELLEGGAEKISNIDVPLKNYDAVIGNLLQIVANNVLFYLNEILKEDVKYDVLLAPVKCLNTLGNRLLEPLKEKKTGYLKKISEYYSVLDIVVGLLKIETPFGNAQRVTRLIESIGQALIVGKKIAIGKGDPQQMSLEGQTKYISSQTLFNVLKVLSLPKMEEKLSDLFCSLKQIPKLFISLQESLKQYVLDLIPFTNKILEDSIRALKELDSSSDKSKESLEKINKNLDVTQLQIIKIILASFSSIFYHHLFNASKKHDEKVAKELYSLLQDITQNLFALAPIQTLMLNIYETADLICKVSEALGVSDAQTKAPMVTITKLCIYHHSIILMQSLCESTDSGQEKADTEQGPQLARLITFDSTETAAEKHQLKKTFSYYKRQDEVDFKTLFANFGLKYSKIISDLFRSQQKTALSSALSIIVPICPWILDLANKGKIMKEKIGAILGYYYDEEYVTIDRKNLILSAMNRLANLEKDNVLQQFIIRYKDESGIDAGGLRRDFFSQITNELFDPNHSLFRVSDNKLSIQPSMFSGIVPHHLTYFEFAGFILAKAIQDGSVVDLHFTKSFLKHIIGKEIAISDLQDIDASLSKNLQWILQNEVKDLDLTFTHEVELFDERFSIELKEKGSDINVTDSNKKEYVKTLCRTKMTTDIENQLKAFLRGFYTIIPRDCLSHLSTGDLQLMIAGTPEIDLEDMKKFARIEGYNTNSEPVKWLWEILKEMKQEDLASFLYFISGSSKVPYGGFQERPIRIRRSQKEGLPIAHTCFYELELPSYDSKDKLREKLLMAIFDGVEGFYIG